MDMAIVCNDLATVARAADRGRDTWAAPGPGHSLVAVVHSQNRRGPIHLFDLALVAISRPSRAAARLGRSWAGCLAIPRARSRPTAYRRGVDRRRNSHDRQ